MHDCTVHSGCVQADATLVWDIHIQNLWGPFSVRSSHQQSCSTSGVGRARLVLGLVIVTLWVVNTSAVGKQPVTQINLSLPALPPIYCTMSIGGSAPGVGTMNTSESWGATMCSQLHSMHAMLVYIRGLAEKAGAWGWRANGTDISTTWNSLVFIPKVETEYGREGNGDKK